MKNRALRPVALLCLALGGCRRTSPPAKSPAEFPNAYAVADCAPWDGPAVTLYLTARPADSSGFPLPHLRISVWRDAHELPGHSFAWPADRQVGAAARCETPTDCRAASSGRVTFAAADPDSALSGSTELTFPGGTTTSGSFRAVWRKTRVMCG